MKKNCDKNGQLSFEAINEIPYLDQVFYEALRLHPAAVTTTRRCEEAVELEFDGKKVQVEKGMNVYVPILSLHLDSDYFVEPNKFHPERFDDGNLKTYLDRCVLMPFGAGPR